MRRKKSLRDHAARRLKIGFIAALLIVISLFLLAPDSIIKPANLHARETAIRPFEGLIVDQHIPEPPKPKNKVVQVTEAKEGEKPDDIIPGPNVDIYEPIGTGRIDASFDSVPFVPFDAEKPKLLEPLDVLYPERMRNLEAEGLVIVGAALDTSGRVFDTRLLKSSGFAELDSAAIKAVRSARFSPAIQYKKPIAVKISVPVRFTLR